MHFVLIEHLFFMSSHIEWKIEILLMLKNITGSPLDGRSHACVCVCVFVSLSVFEKQKCHIAVDCNLSKFWRITQTASK